MKTLFYDTETTGLPDWNKPSDDPSQPRIIQLCAELCDDQTLEVFASLHALIKPDGWTIPTELEAITGITNAKCKAVGVDMCLVLPLFFEMWEQCDQRVAHNESFDMRMVRIELFRDKRYGQEYADQWKSGKAYCTCEKAKPHTRLPPTERMLASGRNGYKPPNLGEAYQHFTGKKLEGAHNATVDVMALKAVYVGIRNVSPIRSAA